MWSDPARMPEHRVKWGITGCLLVRGEDGSLCPRDADLLYDYSESERDGIPACTDCADMMLERALVIESDPGAALPPAAKKR